MKRVRSAYLGWQLVGSCSQLLIVRSSMDCLCPCRPSTSVTCFVGNGVRRQLDLLAWGEIVVVNAKKRQWFSTRTLWKGSKRRPMTTIHTLLPPVVVDTSVHRSALTADEIGEHGLLHPAERQWLTIKRAVPLPFGLGALFLFLWLATGRSTFLLLACAATAYICGLLISAYSGLIGARTLLPDVFLGWSFSESSDQVFVSSRRVMEIAAFLWPDWGVINVLPPPSDSNSRGRDEAGFRGPQWPFVLRITAGGDWRQSAEWLIGQCRVAVFDCTRELTDGLAWEIETAFRVLPPERIARLVTDVAGRTVLSVGTAVIEPPAIVATLEPNSALAAEDYIPLCALRGWVAETLPVSRASFKRRRLWARIDRLLPKVSNLLLITAPTLVIAAVFRWVATLLR